MKATIDFDPVLYQTLKLEAVRRGRTVKELVAEGVRMVLAHPPTTHTAANDPEPPAWLGGLRRYARNAQGDHSLDAIRKSISRGRGSRG